MQQTETTFNRLTLKAILLAEITRLKFGAGFSMTNPKIERIARHNFAIIAGIKKSSSAHQYISAIKKVYVQNNLVEDFNSCVSKFKLDPVIF
jgi:hypothetical protein